MMSFCARGQRPSSKPCPRELCSKVEERSYQTHVPLPLPYSCGMLRQGTVTALHYIIRVAGHSIRREPHIRCQSCTNLLMTCATAVIHVDDSHNLSVSHSKLATVLIRRSKYEISSVLGTCRMQALLGERLCSLCCRRSAKNAAQQRGVMVSRRFLHERLPKTAAHAPRTCA